MNTNQLNPKTQLTSLEQQVLLQLKTGKPLFGKEGALAPLLKHFLENALEAEMECHLDEEERTQGNKRNGKGKKTIKSSAGSFTIATPQDRQSTFEPEIVRKRETILGDSLQEKIIALYSLGMGYREISDHIKEMYDADISPSHLSLITDRLIPEIKAWQSRKLDEIYPMVFMDGMFVQVRDEEGTVRPKALFNVLAINSQGYKEILGSYLHETEGARFWLSVLTDLRNRGVKEMLIACTDNLKGFSEAIASIYPKTEIQTCVVHQIRNSLKYITHKDTKEFLTDLKAVYKADTKIMAEEALVALAKKWGKKYPIVIKSWQDNWAKLSTYFAYPPEIRRLIYTTNIVEGYHRQLRKVIKNKGAFPSDMALLKLVYLATKNLSEKKWTKPLPFWGLAAQQFFIRFGDRMNFNLPIN